MSHMTNQPMPCDCATNDKEPNIFTWCEIPLFTWEGWDEVDTDQLVFYNCKFYSPQVMEALNQYYLGHPDVPLENRTMDVFVQLDGFIQINAIGNTDKDNVTETYCIYEGQICDLHYVRCMLNDRFKEKESTI